MKIGIFGGSFDPFHKGHLHVLQETLKTISLNKIIILPTRQNPNKTRPLISIHERISLLKKHIPQIHNELNTTSCDLEVSTIEETKISFTIDSLKYFQKQHPNSMLYLIIGSDSFFGLHLWKQFEKIKKYATLIVIRRDNLAFEHYQVHAQKKLHLHKSNWILCPNKVLKIASNKIKLKSIKKNPFLLEAMKNDINNTKPIPYIIGLTGRMGSGKSTALKTMGQEKDVESIELDHLGHNCLTDHDIINKLCLEFGNNIMKEKNICRQKLGAIVFNDFKALQKLNAVVHPCLIKRLKEKISDCQKPYLLIAGALLFELNIHKLCHVTINIETKNSYIKKYNNHRIHILKYQLSKKEFRLKSNKTLTNYFDSTFSIKCQQTIRNIKKIYL